MSRPPPPPTSQPPWPAPQPPPWTSALGNRPATVAGGAGSAADRGRSDGDDGDRGAASGGGAAVRGAGTDAGGVGTTVKAAGRRTSSSSWWPLLQLTPRRRRRLRSCGLREPPLCRHGRCRSSIYVVAVAVVFAATAARGRPPPRTAVQPGARAPPATSAHAGVPSGHGVVARETDRRGETNARAIDLHTAAAYERE